jgi:hypothetical protein
MAAREFLRITRENPFKTTFATTPVLNTDYTVIRLDDGNAFAMRAKPKLWEIPFGGGVAIPAVTGSEQMEVGGALKTKFYVEQALFLLNLAITRITSGSLPYANAERIGDLVSFTVDHAYERSDGTLRRRRYVGCKVAGLELECSADNQLASLSLDLVASTPQGNSFDSSVDPTSTVFPEPGLADYPTTPLTFRQTSGGLTLGSVLTQYDSVKISIKNKMDVRFDESRFANRIRFLGRESTLDAKLFLKPSPDQRSLYEAVTARTASLAFNTGVKTVTINYQGQNFATADEDDFAIDKEFYETVSIRNMIDTTAGKDISILVA